MSSSVSNQEKDDCKPVIPLRQRKLPASFWQEPRIAPSPETARGNFPFIQPTSPLIPWPTSLVPPPHTLEFMTPHMWIRNPINCCSCQACLNYSCAVPVYSELRYRPLQCLDSSYVDRSCLFPTYWHPERPSRLRSLRYNALS